MRKFILVLFLLIVLVLAGGVAFLATTDMPAPTATMEREIPNDRLTQ